MARGDGSQSKPYGRPSRFQLMDYASTPAWLATNRYILSGYRVYFSPRLALSSVLRIHNETGNIWSHIGGSALAAGAVYAVGSSSWVFAERPAGSHTSTFTLYGLAGLLAFVASTVYHTFFCVSPGVALSLARIDYLGIAVLMTAAFMPGIHFGFACYPGLALFYQILVGIVGAAAFALLLFPSMTLFHQSYYTRLGLFSSLALLGIVPISHWVVLHGWDAEEVQLILWRMLVLFLGLGLAAVVYVCQIPERWAPGVFDIWGHSHTLWHLLAVGLFWYHFNSALLYLDYTETHPCPKIETLAALVDV